MLNNNLGKRDKWYKKLLTIVWHVPIQLLKEKRQEKRENKK